MFQRAQGTIRSQQQALAARDFEAARAYASDSFRESVSVPDFRRIIQGNYAFLLDDPALGFLECQRQGDTALIQVEVLVMVWSWKTIIDAASIAGSREDVHSWTRGLPTQQPHECAYKMAAATRATRHPTASGTHRPSRRGCTAREPIRSANACWRSIRRSDEGRHHVRSNIGNSVNEHKSVL
jgi:hypothetical protein